MVRKIFCKIVDPLGRITVHCIEYRVEYLKNRSCFKWEKIPGQFEFSQNTNSDLAPKTL